MDKTYTVDSSARSTSSVDSMSESSTSSIDSALGAVKALEQLYHPNGYMMNISPDRLPTAWAIVHGPKTVDWEVALYLVQTIQRVDASAAELRSTLRSNDPMIPESTKEQAIYELAFRGELTLEDVDAYQQAYPHAPVLMLTYLALRRGETVPQISRGADEKRQPILAELFEKERKLAEAMGPFTERYPEHGIADQIKPFQDLIARAATERNVEAQQRAVLEALQSPQFLDYYNAIVGYTARYKEISADVAMFGEWEELEQAVADRDSVPTPMQHLPRWLMFVKDVNKHTPKDSPLSAATESAVKRVSAAVALLNEVVRHAETTK